MKKLLLAIVFIVMAAAISDSSSVFAQDKVLKTDAATADSLHKQGINLMSNGKLEEGRECTRLAMEMRKSLFGELNEGYITSMNNYAISFSMEKNLAKAIELQSTVLELCSRLSKPHKDIGMYTTNMGRLHYQNNDHAQAAKYWEQALPLVEKFGEEYEFLLESLGLIYSESNDMGKLEQIMALTEEHNSHELLKPCNEPGCMLERAEYYSAIEDNVKAKEHYIKVMRMQMDDDMKVKVYDSYSKFLQEVEDYVQAAEYTCMAADILRLHGKGEQCANRMYAAALYNYFAKQFEKAISCYGETVKFFSKYDSSAAKSNIAKCNKGIADCYSALHEFGKAKEHYIKIAEYYAGIDKAGADYAKALLRVAKAEKFNKEYDSSIENHKLAMQLFSNLGMMEEYSDAASSLKLCYAYAGRGGEVDMKEDEVKRMRYAKLDKIIDETKRYLSVNKLYLGNYVYASSFATLAGCYALKEEYADAIGHYGSYMVEVRNAVKELFRMQSEQERMTVWAEVDNNLKQMQELIVMLPQGSEKLYTELSGLIYDKALLSKGILLNSSIEFEKLLHSYGDNTLKEMYEKSKANNEKISLLRQNLSSSSGFGEIAALVRENDELQLSLYAKCKEFADFTDYISYSWRDVQNAVAEGDVAIEFNVIETGPFDTDNYIVAAVLTKGMESPFVVPVCNYSDAGKMESYSELYDLDANLVWGALRPYLTGNRRIFFSADGHFNRIGIEYLKYDGKPFCDQFEVYRLSSTKELCYKRKREKVQNVALFGDVDYNDDSGVSSAAVSSVESMRSVAGDNMFGHLDNTLREVDEIQAMLKAGNIKNVESFKAGDAGSSVFFKLADSKVNWLHIATHGAYRNDEKGSDSDAMKNSFLVFAGANFDSGGIVTAADISKMNLRNCDMVVLSACETGLGKLGADGVFGLQRGFKNAGVNTLLMSLREVHDASTADLMIFFYRNLMKGLSKREALITAQKQLRDAGYTNATHWTSFILLDAFDRN